MKKIALAISLILTSGSYVHAHDSASQLADSQYSQRNAQTHTLSEHESLPAIIKQYVNPAKQPHRISHKFKYETDLAPGTYTYIIELIAPSVLEKPELKRTLEHRRTGSIKHLNDQAIKSHVTYLKGYQTAFLRSLDSKIKESVVTQYEYILNGVALRITQEQAELLASHQKVKRITRETIYQTTTDQGPVLVGAPQLWQGSIGSLQQTQGEGVVVGIIDSGINSDHPSFAEISGDGYVHNNPLGDGVYLGDCAGQFAELCNNKLIGIYSYNNITDSYADTDVFPPNLPRNGEDYDGHGTHVAATAVGNILNDLPETLPTQGEIESDGTPTGFTFEQISGVAPRANLIAYQVCFVGRADQDDTYAGCPGSAINRGIEDAIKDGVDIINFSISGGGDPWRDSTESAFLRAQGVGIFVATSAGNSGPGESSSDKQSPWYTAVAASEHGRQNAFVKQIRNFSGGLSTPTVITGQSNTPGVTGNIVYAGDVNNPNDPDNDSAQCLQPFPANTFNNQIVVCDRGEIARVEKAENVQAGGALGYVLANVQGGETFLANDAYVIPGIHINADDGDRLKQWLATGANHRISITEGVPSQNTDLARIDVLASFSSRGPNTIISTLTPTVTAPGVDIYAAYADQRFGHDGHEASAGDFNYLSGTSMSSPHVAGAAALLKALHPDWTPDNIRSALAMTATTSVRLADASTPADFFDMGSGRIRVDLAAQTGLLLNETNTGYLAAEPAIGGDPRALNLPSITDNECATICTWSRTFTATQDGVWDVSGQSTEVGLKISVSPESFSIQAGQTQTIEISIDTINADKNRYVFGQINLTANNSPDLHIPISVLSSIGDIPTLISTVATRDADSVLIDDIEAISLNSFVLTPTALTKAINVNGEISQDSDNTDYFDNLDDGVVITEVTVPEDAKRLIVELISSSAPDLDLYLVYDRNDDGFLSISEEIGMSQSGNSTEEIQLNYPDAGRYFIVVQSFTSSPSQTDSFEMRYAIVNHQPDSSLQAEAPSALQADVPFDMRVIYALEDAELGDDYFGAIEMGSSADRPDNLGIIAIDIRRGDDDLVLMGDPVRVSAGDTVPLSVVIAGNNTNEDRTYSITIPAAPGTNFSNAGVGDISAAGLNFVVTKASTESLDTTLNFDVNIVQAELPGPIEINMLSELLNRNSATLQQAPAFTGVQIEGPPSIDFDISSSTGLTVFEGQTFTVPITVTDPNQDTISLVYTQTAGPIADISQVNGVSELVAPMVDEDTVLNYDVEASDGNGNTATSSFAVTVMNNAPPVINTISAPNNATQGQRITITVTASDPENDLLTVTINGVIGSSFSTTTPLNVTSVSYAISVSDGTSTVNDSVNINLSPAPVTPSGSSGGSSSMLCLLLLGTMMLIRRQIKLHT